ncbi:hypothetical protein GCM10025771_15290 [Niveibacterium umoris]|uniref:Methyltransferase type 11 domain-containing protein n=1 Tax=Niveibacterium umoris TaxID=1193620 RepID=A0A840BUW9_9RHOO|nr:hypothetical protein [Niveibacterium umoris]MBB4014596.1 hypothetical protein [Niveibacterium umoris]
MNDTSARLRLNLGCGHRKLPGFLNVDKYPACEPDAVVDLEQFPWPWGDDSVAEVQLLHVLEHLGAAPDVYLGLMRELWRVCCDGAAVHIVVPHPRHDSFLNDPTHVRAVTGDGLLMFSQKANRRWVEQGAANTPLGLYLGIDFDLVSTEIDLDPWWQRRLQAGEVDREGVFEAARRENNVIRQSKFVLIARKGDRETEE